MAIAESLFNLSDNLALPTVGQQLIEQAMALDMDTVRAQIAGQSAGG